MLVVIRSIQARDGIRSSELRRQSKIRDAVAWAKLSKIRAVTDWISRDVRRTPANRTHWSTMVRDRDEWRRYWRPLEQIDDQRDDW
ncbi:hypothetical protein Q1695_015908 [Nippostrongylus brasiliensis]|nr:hypothetical protein Q1695_015908 [Nippostrongylus brasiliensis]